MPRLLLTVPEAAETLAISRSKLYELLASGAGWVDGRLIQHGLGKRSYHTNLHEEKRAVMYVGLEERQLDELEERVAELSRAWDKRTGRPREITREALVITCGYMRQIYRGCLGRYIRRRSVHDFTDHYISTPLVEQATAEFRPAPEEAAEATRGRSRW